MINLLYTAMLAGVFGWSQAVNRMFGSQRRKCGYICDDFLHYLRNAVICTTHTKNKNTRHSISRIKPTLNWSWNDTNKWKSSKTSGYATWFMAGGPVRIAHYDVIDDVITRKLQQIEKNGDQTTSPHEIVWAIQWWKPHRSTTTFAKPEMTLFMTS